MGREGRGKGREGGGGEAVKLKHYDSIYINNTYNTDLSYF